MNNMNKTSTRIRSHNKRSMTTAIKKRKREKDTDSAPRSAAEAKGIMVLSLGALLGAGVAYYLFSQVEVGEKTLEFLPDSGTWLQGVMRVVYAVLVGGGVFVLTSLLMSFVAKNNGLADFMMEAHKVLLFFIGLVLGGGITGLVVYFL